MTEESIFRFQIDAEFSDFEMLGSRIEEFGDERGLPPSIVYTLNLTLEELITNTIKYGHVEGKPLVIEGAVSVSPGYVELSVEDDGLPFNPVERPDPDMEQSIEEKSIGGLGIYLVRQLNDEVDYERRNGRNLVRVRKNL